MTGEVINLRRARKAKVRSEKEKRAEENRVRFGRRKTDKVQETAEKAAAERRHEGHLRVRDDATVEADQDEE